MSGVLHYQRKPERQDRRNGLRAALYEPGKPLGDLLAVAHMASDHAEMAEVRFGRETVLVVRYRNQHRDDPDLEYEPVHAGHYLAYSEQYGSLLEHDEAELRQWYDLAPEPGRP
jgi:hypothetical protein